MSPTPLLTLEQLRERVGWEHVRQVPMAEHQMVVFHVCPEQPHLDPIDFVFDEEVTFLMEMGMGIWHSHPDEIDDALDMADRLVRHELSILEERDTRGEYCSSGPVEPNGIPRTLGRNPGWLRRILFNREPVREEIDFSRCVRGKRSWIEARWQKELEQTYRVAGLPVPEW
jgi:hypothetical protein